MKGEEGAEEEPSHRNYLARLHLSEGTGYRRWSGLEIDPSLSSLTWYIAEIVAWGGKRDTSICTHWTTHTIHRSIHATLTMHPTIRKTHTTTPITPHIAILHPPENISGLDKNTRSTFFFPSEGRTHHPSVSNPYLRIHCQSFD